MAAPRMFRAPLVLLVEPEDIARVLAERALREAGFAVLALADGREALIALFQGPERFDALVTDVATGVLDGWALASHARRLRPAIQVVLLADAWTGAHVRRSIGGPPPCLVCKPVPTPVLVASVARILGTR